jgi:hypothetical protein
MGIVIRKFFYVIQILNKIAREPAQIDSSPEFSL